MSNFRHIKCIKTKMRLALQAFYGTFVQDTIESPQHADVRVTHDN